MKNIQGIYLAWIIVKDLNAAVQFYTDVVGLTLQSFSQEYGWAEMSGPEGAVLGIAQENPEEKIQAGSNAVVTITVGDVLLARDSFVKKGGRLLGDILEIPGHVKMQTILDQDGNMLQLVEKLD